MARRPVEVIEDQYERRILGGVPQERRDGIEEAEPRALRFQVVELWCVGKQVPQIGQEVCEIRRSRTELPLQSLAVAVSDVGAERLHPRPVGGCAAGLPAPAPEHGGAPRVGMGRELVGESALADSRLAGKEREAPVPKRESSNAARISPSSRSRPTKTPAARRPRWSAASGRSTPGPGSSCGSWFRIARSSSWRAPPARSQARRAARDDRPGR